jgi:hypothetical protein
MNYLPITKFINYKDYDYIVSIGNKCPTSMTLKAINVYGKSFPFDSIPTTPHLILKYLKNQDDFYPKRNTPVTDDKVWFGHFNLHEIYEYTIDTFKRRFARLLDILQNKKKILFVYTTEADIYNQMNNRYNDNFNDLLKIVDYIIETYKYDDFKLLCIHVNKSFADTNNIVNYTINVPDRMFSDDMSTHNEEVTSNYRNILPIIMKEIFKIV